MLELDFKEKSILLDYYIDIGTNIVNLIKENNHANPSFKLSEDKLVEQIIGFTREKQKDYKTRSINMKDKNIFEFLERKNNMADFNPLNASINVFSSKDLQHSSFKIKSNDNFMKSQNKIPTVESRYNEENESFTKPPTSTQLVLSNDIMNKIDDNNKNLIYVIHEFISNERLTLESSFEEIENDKVNTILT
jgi:hypothetical protein